MNDYEKLEWLFKEIHGEVRGSRYIEIDMDDECCGREHEVRVMKDGHLCWSVTKTDLLFDYVTRHLDDVLVS